MLSERLGPLAFLAVRHRLQPDVPPHARPGAARHAAADLHLPGRPRLGDVEPRHDARRAAPGRWRSLIFVVNVVVSLRRGKPAGDDPWDAWTLEWATTSPPPPYNFETRPGGHEPPAAVGPEASRRPGRAARMRATHAAMRHAAGDRGSRVARPRRDDRAHRRRGLALRGVRGRLPLLHRQEPQRPVSRRTCSSCPCSARSACWPAASTVALGVRALARGDVRRAGRLAPA